MKREELIETWFANVQALQRGWKSRFHVELAGEQLTIGQLSMLLYIQSDQPVSSKQMAAKLSVTKGAVAQFLEGLDQLGLITREHDPADRRILYVSLSKAGEAKAQFLHDRRKAFFTKLASVMSDDEMELMITVQQKMVQQIESAANGEIDVGHKATVSKDMQSEKEQQQW